MKQTSSNAIYIYTERSCSCKYREQNDKSVRNQVSELDLLLVLFTFKFRKTASTYLFTIYEMAELVYGKNNENEQK